MIVREEIEAERWAEIDEFPGYIVSDQGHVARINTNAIVAPQIKDTGLMVVGLMLNGKQYKRSLPLLVATAFLPPPVDTAYDTPINLDGDRSNNHYMNLKWRPLWFARRYIKQFDREPMCTSSPLEDIATGEIYENSMHAATFNGLLEADIYASMLNRTYVWPTRQMFRVARS